MSTRKSKAAIAAVALSAVALTGSTLALWEEAGVAEGAELVTGHLDLAVAGEATAADVSPDTGNVAVDLAEFRAVPGDRIRVAQTVTVDAAGDNIAAELLVSLGGAVSVAGGNITGEELTDGITLASAYLVEGAVQADAGIIPDDVVGVLGAPITIEAGEDQAFTIVYELNFAADDQEFMDVSAVVDEMNVFLVQVRDAAAECGNFVWDPCEPLSR